MKIQSMLTIGWLMAGSTIALAQDEIPAESPQEVAQEEQPAPPSAQPTKPAAESPAAPNDAIEEDLDDDPFADPWSGYHSLPRIPAARLTEARTTLQVRLKIWEVDTKVFALAMDGFTGPEAIGAWRQQRLTNADNRLVHAPTVVLDAQSRSTVESILERIYPTEYEPPELLPDKAIEQLLAERAPQTLGQVIEQLTTGATPTAFETRNTGLTLEAAAQPVTGEPDCWDLSLSFEEVLLSGTATYGPEALQVTMPNFTSFRSGGLLRVANKRWQLVSAMAPASYQKDEGPQKTWVTLVRVDPAR